MEPGPAAELSVGLETPASATLGVYPPFAFSPSNAILAYGWRDDSLDVALRVGAGFSSIFQGAGDAYVQLPRRALFGLDGGVGVAAIVPSLASTAPMPYAELGFVRSGNGPYVVLGYVHQPSGESIDGPEIQHAEGWETTLAYQLSDDRKRWRPFATGVIGHRVSAECFAAVAPCERYVRPWTLFFGLSLERTLRR